jgi:CubicO group peptidase (beta-lactamase class C family)
LTIPVSGLPFSSYVCDHILRPLSIERHDLGYAIADRDHQAAGYLEKYSLMNLMKGFLINRALIGDYDGRWLRIGAHYPNRAAFGGLVGTVRGFGTFLQDQLRIHSALFSDSTRRLFYECQETLEGRSIAMTLGWHVGELPNKPFFCKEGGGGGFHAMMRLYPEAQRAV